MKISTITNLAYGITVALTALSGAAFILSDQMAAGERRAVEVHLALGDLGAMLEVDAELRTDEARLYVMRGDPAHLALFEKFNEDEHRLERLAMDAADLGATEQERAQLARVTEIARRLEQIETAALDTYRAGDQTAARDALFGDEHYSEHVRLIAEVERLRSMVAQRTGLDLQRAQLWSDWLGVIARTLLGLTAAVFLGVLYFVLRRRVALPLNQMAGIVRRLARQDYEVEMPQDDRRDEIGELTAAIRVFRENGLERERLDAERKRDLKMKDLILQMMHRMQACQTVPEIADVVSRFCPQIFPDLGGELFVRNDPKLVMRRTATWRIEEANLAGFDPEECWGLRRGRAHQSSGSREDVQCSHVDASRHADRLCIPLTAHGDTIGVLSFVSLSDDAGALVEDKAYLGMIAENVGLAVANLQLRERLTNLAVRDPVTGLLNRRSLDQALVAFASEEPPADVTCLVLDIDHFKRFNDTFGHDAGDVMLCTFAELLSETIGEAGACYRFGGEEFAVLLPNTTRESALRLAEHVRTRTATKSLTHAGRILGPITVSIGLADSREGRGVASLRTRADLALLAAKTQGRNCSVYDGALARSAEAS